MILYKDNKNLKFKTVKTVTGETEYRRNCRKIRNAYYVIGKDCVEVNNRWYLTSSKLITRDYETGEYVLLKDTPLVYGIVKIESSGEPVFGYFSENKFKNVFVNVKNYGTVKCYNENILKEGGFTENISDGVWRFSKNLSPSDLVKLRRINSQKVFTNKGYNIEDNAAEFQEKIEMFEKYPLKITPSAMRYGKLLGKTSFGCELETSKGFVPEHLQYQTGLIICRDGSIDNAEYVTIPMRGAKGLMNLKRIGEILSERTLIDIKCAFHIHLGTLPTDRLFIVALYALAMAIQDEIFKMFPYYKTEPQGIKKRNYNQKLKKIGIRRISPKTTKQEFTEYVDDAYYRIFTWLNDGTPPDNNFNRVNHHHRQTAKWNRKERYFWINFMNMFFSERKTIEFRLHQPTRNSQKMINWLFICNAIVKYAETNAKKILMGESSITLEEVVNWYKEEIGNKEACFLSEYLNAYINDRKTYFLRDYKNNDYLSLDEMNTDCNYSFSYKDVQHLF